MKNYSLSTYSYFAVEKKQIFIKLNESHNRLKK